LSQKKQLRFIFYTTGTSNGAGFAGSMFGIKNELWKKTLADKRKRAAGNAQGL